MKNYLIERNKQILKEWKEWLLFRKVPVQIIKPFSNPQINLRNVLILIENYLQDHRFVSFIEGIYIGEFPELKNRQVQAVFNNGVIYVSSLIANNVTEDRIAKDIIHELGHSIEDNLNLEIYGDDLIRDEFLGKRIRLYNLLSFDGFNVSRELFNSTEYSETMDTLLYKGIGYKTIESEIKGLFVSPYCVTSLSEFFANGFETYITGDLNYLKQICPILYSKLEMLTELIKEM
jgi:hypothetical protein